MGRQRGLFILYCYKKITSIFEIELFINSLVIVIILF